MLAAIGVMESYFNTNKLQICDPGMTWAEDNPKCSGAGAFQIDLNQHPNVSKADALNLSTAASLAAKTLNDNMAYLGNKFWYFTADELLQATAASYNLGKNGISGNPDTIDKGSRPDNHYGRNILELMNCF